MRSQGTGRGTERREENHHKSLAACVVKRDILGVYTTVKRSRKPTPQNREAKTKACPKCLDLHGSGGPCNKNFLCRNEECKRGDAPPDHYFFLCLKSPAKKDTARGETKGEKKREPRGPTEEQEAVFASLGLMLEQLEAVRKACTKCLQNVLTKVWWRRVD